MSISPGRPPFLWRPSRNSAVALAAGLAAIALSLAMGRFAEGAPWLGVLLRDVLMIGVLGVWFPLAYIAREGGPTSGRGGRGPAAFGLSAANAGRLLVVNAVLGALLLGLLWSTQGPFQLTWTPELLGRAIYVMLTGIFEAIFFYAFVRTLFERDFGAVPAVVLTALLYSFHHAGFEPEYVKLFFVGLLYGAAVLIAGSVWVIYPFFWGAGALFDVLVQSQRVGEIADPWLRGVLLAVIFLLIGAWARTQQGRVPHAPGS